MPRSEAKPTILRVACDDARGIIYRITGLLAERGLNVIEQEEYVDSDSGRFFLRTAIEGVQQPAHLQTQVEDLLEGARASVELRLPQPRRIAILVTHEEHCLGDLLLRQYGGELAAEIVCVLGNSDKHAGLVKRFDLPFLHVPSEGLSHAEHDKQVSLALDPFAPDLLVFAKYMRIVGEEFIRAWPEKIINIHHSFLPAFVGAKPYHRAHERGVKIIGASAHFVTADLDAGPIIAQDVVSVRHNHGVSDLIRSGRNVEKITLARALRLVLEGRIFVHGNRTVVFD